jgi:hypothetical protein
MSSPYLLVRPHLTRLRTTHPLKSLAATATAHSTQRADTHLQARNASASPADHYRGESHTATIINQYLVPRFCFLRKCTLVS